MDEYIIVTTFCDKKEIANKIINRLLEKRLVASSQVSKVHSKYWWNNELEESDEYKLEFRTKESLFYETENEIRSKRSTKRRIETSNLILYNWTRV